MTGFMRHTRSPKRVPTAVQTFMSPLGGPVEIRSYGENDFFNRAPTETLRVIQGVQNSFWGMASVAGAPAMQVVFRGHVTDMSGKENRVVRADISKPPTHAMMLLLHNNHDARRPQVLEARECAGIDASFFVQPVVGVDGKPWRATVIFVDQYGNAHKIRNCVFRSLNANITPQPKEPEEFPYEMADPIERESFRF
jgi:hypothetical protein